MFGKYRLISYHILKEIITYFSLSCLVFSFLFLMGKIFDLTRLIIVHHVKVDIILKLLFYTLPYFFSYIIPISALLSTLLTFLRLTQDKEYIALKTTGISPKILLRPLIPFAFFCLFSTLFITSLGIPWGSGAARDLVFKITQQQAEITIRPGVFNDRLPGIIIYVGALKNRHFQNIFIYDERKKEKGFHTGQTIIARLATLKKEGNKIIFHLQDGCILKTEKNKNGQVETHFLSYQDYNFTLDLPSTLKHRHKNPKEYTPWQLWQRIKQFQRQKKDPTTFILAFHRKLSLPASAFIFVFLGAVLGLKEEGKRRLGGITLGLGCFVLYQLLFSAASSLGETHTLPPHLSLWLPNLVMAVLTIYLWRRVING